MKELFLYQISNKFKFTGRMKEKLMSLGTINTQIKQIREALGMTQDQLSRRSSIKRYYISNLEQGKENPSINTLKKIANGLNCDLYLQMVPRDELTKLVDDLASAKADELLSQINGSNLLEDQKVNKKFLKMQHEDLKNELINNRQSLLWS